MSILNLEKTTPIKQQLSGDNLKILVFWAEWCTPYKYIMPIIEEIDSKLDGVDFIKVNTDEVPNVSDDLGIAPITTLPSLVFLKNGRERATLHGAIAKENIILIVERIKSGIDMSSR